MSSLGSTFGRLRPPPRLLWSVLSVFALLVLLFSLLDGALLFGVVVVSFVVLWSGVGWLVYAYAEQRGAPIVQWPVRGALVASVLVLLYALLIEQALLLGIVAAMLLVAASVVVGVLLTLEGR
ncbi:hypothetical protein ACFPYI_01150 [Halomarina salina]|uniref:Uncharacterized protein n=1 Tax=Halomarina salina TaxID=1872699 RepID=A0ABD5RH89_9EURY|nr:hypothetical protein [Halomarina salina]